MPRRRLWCPEQDSKELYDRHVGDRLAALNSNRAAQASLQQRIIAAQEELGVLLGARKVRDDKLQVSQMGAPWAPAQLLRSVV